MIRPSHPSGSTSFTTSPYFVLPRAVSDEELGSAVVEAIDGFTVLVILVGVGIAFLLGMVHVRNRGRDREELEERVVRESFFSGHWRH